jgi:hypothetical protein
VPFQVAVCVPQPETALNKPPPSSEISNSTVPVGATGTSDPGEVTVNPAVAVMVWPVTDGLTTAETWVRVEARFTVWVTAPDVDVVKLTSPEYTASISTPDEVAAKTVAHAEAPVWLPESQLKSWVEHPAMSFQVDPLSLEYWKSTEPDGGDGLSEPGAVINTVAVAVTP